MQVTLDLSYNEIDALLTVISVEVNRSINRSSSLAPDTIECLRNVERKLEPVFEKADPEDE